MLMKSAALSLTEQLAERFADRIRHRLLAPGARLTEDSLLGRFGAWRVSSAIALSNPVFGGGFRAVQSSALWDSFKDGPTLLPFIEVPPSSPSGLAAHSIWFEVMGDLGVVGLFLCVALLVNAFLTLRQVWKLVRANGQEQRWAGDLADMLGISMLAFVVTGSSLSAAYFELPYVCMMLLEVLKQQQLRLSAAGSQPKPA